MLNATAILITIRITGNVSIVWTTGYSAKMLYNKRNFSKDI